jgi:hypothetical protein
VDLFLYVCENFSQHFLAGILGIDWIGALDVSAFRGRAVERTQLTQWILQEGCRLVVVLGMGGIGKSVLVSLLGLQLSEHFEAVLWRSVRDAPSCKELVTDCISFFSEMLPAELPVSFERRIDLLGRDCTDGAVYWCSTIWRCSC